MTAPASVHVDRQRRVALIVEREYQPDPDRCVRAILALLAARPSGRDGPVEPTRSDILADGDRQ